MSGRKRATSEMAGVIEHDSDNGDDSDSEQEEREPWDKDKPCDVSADGGQVPEEDFVLGDDDINLDSPFLRDMIATIPVSGVQEASITCQRAGLEFLILHNFTLRNLYSQCD